MINLHYFVYKNKIFIFFLILLICSCNSNTKNKDLSEFKTSKKIDTINNIVSVEDLEKKYLYRCFVEFIEFNNTKKENITGLVNGVEKNLKNILQGKQKLVIEYSPLSCGLCVDSLFTYVSKSKLNKNLIIITGSKNINLIKVELNKYNLKGSILMTDITEKTLKQDNSDPKIYLLDSDMTIDHYISIDKLMVNYLKTYIRLMEEKI